MKRPEINNSFTLCYGSIACNNSETKTVTLPITYTEAFTVIASGTLSGTQIDVGAKQNGLNSIKILGFYSPQKIQWATFGY